MDDEAIIAKLKILKDKSPILFNTTVNRIKLENPTLYNRLKLIFPELKDTTTYSEEPLEIKLTKDEVNELNSGTIFIVILILAFLIVGIYVFLFMK